MPNPLNTATTLQRGVRSDFRNTYRSALEGVRERISSVMALGLNSDQFEELYAYRETMRYPSIVPWGEGGTGRKPGRARSFSVINRRITNAVEWLERDRVFDNLGGLAEDARGAGQNFATFPERVFYQVMTAGTDGDLLPAVPNAPDGAALYAATDGSGANRFGVSGGNTFSGSGVANPQSIRDDFFTARERLRQFQDTEGEPLHDDSILDGRYKLFFEADNEQVVREAFQQTSTADGSNNVSNIILDTGMQITLVPTQRISTDDIYVWLEDFRFKAIFEQEAMAIRETPFDRTNDPDAREVGYEGVHFETWRGYGVALPIMTVRIDN